MSVNLRLVSGILNVSKSELNLRACLKGGMSFRWSLKSDDESMKTGQTSVEYVGVANEKIYILKQIESKNLIEYSVYLSEKQTTKTEIEIRAELEDYFRLNENLAELYGEWSTRDAKFREKVETYANVLGGVRVLRLDPVENLFSFICSSNNNIKRITQMVANMCVHFGRLIGTLDNVNYYSFPTIDRLAENDVEQKLRQLNFGYRAKYINQAAVYLKKNFQNEKWLYSLREKPYDEVTAELVKIPGIGKKVADCICLMSLDKLEAIPVDTHVLSIARNLYHFADNSNAQTAGKSKTNGLTDKSYKIIANKFRELWGKYAGWAQTVMFIDDLRDFQKQKSESSLISPTASVQDDKPNNKKNVQQTNKRTSAQKTTIETPVKSTKKLKSISSNEMNASNAHDHKSLLPPLVSTQELKNLLKSKGIVIQDFFTKDDLMQLYNTHVQPKPQRVMKTNASSHGRKTHTTKIKNNLEADLDTKSKRLKQATTVVGEDSSTCERMETDVIENKFENSLTINEKRHQNEFTSEISTSQSPTKKIKLKRTRLNSGEASSTATADDSHLIDELKKSKLN